MGAKNILDEKNVPKCEKCGEKRKFEMQIMPQLLHHLKQGKYDLDWGILVVYTCPKSCGDGSKGYFEEFIYCQKSHGDFGNADENGMIG